MTLKSAVSKLTQIEQLNFLITNRIPRRYMTLFMGWFSRIENPLVSYLSITLWRFFADDLNLEESRQQKFKSMHECFTRELKDGVRPVNRSKEIITSPCDAIVGACGKIKGNEIYQAKGFPYTLYDLLNSTELTEKYRDGSFVTLRLQSSMYHHFHAPCDCNINQLTYISGDTWNVNPVALKRVEKLFCKNERAIINLNLDNTELSITLVPVAAILVASMRFKCLSTTLDLKYKGPNIIPCNASYLKGENMGNFQQGSTIIVFANKPFKLHESITEGQRINLGEALFRTG